MLCLKSMKIIVLINFWSKTLKLEKSILISSVIKKMVKLWQINLY